MATLIKSKVSLKEPGSRAISALSIGTSLCLLAACAGLDTATPPASEPQKLPPPVIHPVPKKTPPPVIKPPPHATPRESQAPSPAQPGLKPAATAPNPPATPPSPADLVFFDNFEYVVDRNDANAVNIFMQNRWTWAKTEQSNKPGANGYLYTATSIPGYRGAFPGGASSRVLVMEARPGSEGAQTDFYLQYGDGQNPVYDDAVPGNVWFQFWIYINSYGNQTSLVDARSKFIYPCNGNYPCHTGKWLISLVNRSYEPYWQNLGSPSSLGGFLINDANTFAGIGEVTNSTASSPENRYKLGHTNTAERIFTNRWTLVKIHVDTSTSSGRYEAWMRPLGGAWTKTAEWISGVTPGFTWTINREHVGGHRVIRMPTTMGRASGSGYDAWYYMDDFAIARTEAGLPVYEQ